MTTKHKDKPPLQSVEVLLGNDRNRYHAYPVASHSLRYCARPPFALERLELIDEQRAIYRLPRTQRDGTRALSLTPLELIDQLAALIPPPRLHRHRYGGVLAPNSLLRAAAVVLGRDLADEPNVPAEVTTPSAASAPNAHSPARYLWAMLLARLFESLRLVCPNCGADMHTEGLVIGLSKRERFHPVNPNLGKRRRLRDQEPGFGTRDIARSRCCRSSVRFLSQRPADPHALE